MSDSYERNYGGSIPRYLGSAVIAWAIALALLLYSEITKRYLFVGLILSISGSLLALLSNTQLRVDLSQANQDTLLMSTRGKIEEAYEKVKPYLTNQERVYFVSQESKGYDKNVFAYLAMPNQINYWCWTFGEKFEKDDPWTCSIESIKEIANYQYLVNGYDYPCF